MCNIDREGVRMARTGFVSVLQCVVVCCEDGCMACNGFWRVLQCVAVCWEDACMVRSGECVAVYSEDVCMVCVCF